ncbi:MAG: ABC transporter ATP-binding protein [Clostridiales Family XIII bacterium]|jgi:branched-chain amino acid transport system ATP-binding protein|nr:ABC transporter ATP-binding protein [Clostridiales Family XIII bacterium]
MSDTGSILKIDNLNVHYGDFQALYDVSMEIKKGRVTSIIGSNGSGKTTLLNTVMGINKPTSGSITLNDKDISGMRTSKIVADGVTMSPEGSSIFEDMTIKENLLMGAYLPHARKRKTELVEKAFSLFPDLREKSGQLASLLSGGQRQMLSIAKAIVTDPQVIICDEISLGLAPVIIKDIYKKIKEINAAGMTVLLVEQEVKRSLKHSDYSYIMVKGRVVMEGVSGELPEEEVSSAYFGINKYA